MLNILEKIRSTKTETAASLREKLTEIETAIPPALVAVRVLDAERSAGLLSLDDKALEVIEGKLAKAKRDADRLAAARGEIERRLAEREEADLREPVEAAVAAAEARAATFAGDFLRAYEKAAAPLAKLMNEFAAIEQQITLANSDMLDLHRKRGSLNGMPAPVRTIADRISNGKSAFSVFMAATRIVPTEGQPGYPAGQ